jgi:cobalt-zinc-cadmium efflux system outer membrane protein
LLATGFDQYSGLLRTPIVLVALSVLTGCVKYRPKPLEPLRLEQEYRARSLSEPGLRSFVEANASAKPSQWPPTNLNLEALTLVAFYYSSELEIARAQVARAHASIVTARGRPNPSLSVGGGWSNSPESAFIFHFDPGFLIETARKRGYRTLEAQRQAEVARLEFAEAGWRIRSRLRAALLDHWLALRESELLAAEEQVRAEALRIFEQRLAAGEVSRPDVDVAATARNSARVALTSAQGRVAETLAALAAAAGMPVRPLAAIGFDWPDFEKPPGAETLPIATVQTAGLLNRLDVRRALMEYAVAETALQLEVARQYPDIQWNPGYSFDEGHHKFAIGPTLTLPVFNRNQGPIAEARARREEAAARFTALQAQAISEMEKGLAQYNAALAELTQVETQLVTLQQRREKANRRAFEIGEADRLALAEIRVHSAVAARARLEALRKAQAALGALEDALQHPTQAGMPVLPGRKP